jgi:hypothetical protein
MPPITPLTPQEIKKRNQERHARWEEAHEEARRLRRGDLHLGWFAIMSIVWIVICLVLWQFYS